MMLDTLAVLIRYWLLGGVMVAIAKLFSTKPRPTTQQEVMSIMLPELVFWPKTLYVYGKEAFKKDQSKTPVAEPPKSPETNQKTS